MIPPKTLDIAIIQATTSGVKVNIYRLESGTHVIAPAGYDMPDKAKLVGYVERDGNFTQTDNDGVPKRH